MLTPAVGGAGQVKGGFGREALAALAASLAGVDHVKHACGRFAERARVLMSPFAC
jgi:hypothetical protein